MQNQEHEYIAFISYKREDEKWAKWLQGKLDNYKLPSILKKEYPDASTYTRPTFRDVTDLSVGPLEERIHEGLTKSKYLIVVCSPNSAKSHWVGKEVEDFIKLGKEQFIIPFIIDGIPHSGNEETECFPLALKNVKKEIVGANINEQGKNIAALKVIARLLDIQFSKIYRRYEINRRRQLFALGVIGLLIVILSLGLSALFSYKNEQLHQINTQLDEEKKKTQIAYDSLKVANERDVQRSKELAASNEKLNESNRLLEKERDNVYRTNIQLSEEKERVLESNKQILMNESRYLSSEVYELISQDKIEEAKRLALKILPKDISNPDRPYVPEAEKALRVAMKATKKAGFKLVGTVRSEDVNKDSFREWGIGIDDGGKLHQINNTSKYIVKDSKRNNKLIIENLEFSKSDSIIVNGSILDYSIDEKKEWIYLLIHDDDEFEKKLISYERGMSEIFKRRENDSVTLMHKMYDYIEKENRFFAKQRKYVKYEIQLWNLKDVRLISSRSIKEFWPSKIFVCPNGNSFILYGRENENRKRSLMYVCDAYSLKPTKEIYRDENSVQYSFLQALSFGTSNDLYMVFSCEINGVESDYLKIFNSDFTMAKEFSFYNQLYAEVRIVDSRIPCELNSICKKLLTIKDEKLLLIDFENNVENVIEFPVFNNVVDKIISNDGKTIIYNDSGYYYIYHYVQENKKDGIERISFFWGELLNSEYLPAVCFFSNDEILWSQDDFELIKYNIKEKGAQSLIYGFDSISFSQIIQNKLEKYKYSPNYYYGCPQSPIDNVYVMTDNGEILLKDVVTEEIKQTFNHQPRVVALNFSADGNYLATAGLDKVIRIWDLRSNMEIDNIVSEHAIFSVDFSPNGKRIVYSSQDGIKIVPFYPLQELINEANQSLK